jgi:signal transduction histidine kinase
MNPSLIILFLHGVVFFALGIALALTYRQTSEFRFARALRPLAAFGLLYGSHVWVLMFQILFPAAPGLSPLGLSLLVIALALLLYFALTLLLPRKSSRQQKFVPLMGIVLVWLTTTLLVTAIIGQSPAQQVETAATLACYILGLPATVFGAWALMVQQHSFRERDMAEFGRDLVWCAAALLLYGLVSFVFVPPTAAAPSNLINDNLFATWFGIPVQLFQLVLGIVFTVFMLRALNAFELEQRRRLARAHQDRLDAQTAALEAVNRTSQEMESLNDELRLTARELTLLLNLSTLLATPMSMEERLGSVLNEIVTSLDFSVAGTIVLVDPDTGQSQLAVSTGFRDRVKNQDEATGCAISFELGEQVVEQGSALCCHMDGQIFELLLQESPQDQQCRLHVSSVEMIGLPLTAQSRMIGALVLAAPENGAHVSVDEFSLMIGIGQQLGLSIENARLYQDLQKREKTLAELLHQIVGAQESERRRIARDLHDATGQSLTAISLGLRGIEAMLQTDRPVKLEQIRNLQLFGTNAITELRRIIADLRPSQLDDLGLRATLRWYLQEFEQRHNISTTLHLPESMGRLPAEFETVLFRIVQEGLINVAKHAEASTVSVKVERGAEFITLRLEDDGRGFDADEVFSRQEHHGWGLLGIQERVALLGGRYELESAPGQGCRISVYIPLRTEMRNVRQDQIAVS